MAKKILVQREQSGDDPGVIWVYAYFLGEPGREELEGAVVEAGIPAEHSFLGLEPNVLSERAGVQRWVLGPAL